MKGVCLQNVDEIKKTEAIGPRKMNSKLAEGTDNFKVKYLHNRLPWWLSQERVCLQWRRLRFNTWVRKIPWRRQWQPTPVFLSRESHWQRNLAGYSPWGHKESDTTERLMLLLLSGWQPWSRAEGQSVQTEARTVEGSRRDSQTKRQQQ